ncbi:MAG: alpha-glucosidase C-terminal domain-containing protein [Deltaproteobacteria bacterium]|jgi:glycosidase|nr:alpha-glucosidase C-terminal domain-containing protein [Deltaproteobacteria bacterium]
MSWWNEAFFYHIYPLGCCGAPRVNDFSPVPRLRRLAPWLEHLRAIGADALLLGPVFQSETHGYDTTNYFMPDNRLGTDTDLAWLVSEARRLGIRVVLDGVFNHVGRSFFAFRDVLEKGRQSRFVDWFSLSFDARSPLGDPFSYEPWRGHYELVKLNTGHPEVRGHLFHALAQWITRYKINGVRLDSADCLDFDFQKELSRHCKELKPDFYCMGEVIHGDYSRWLNAGGLDAVTNYVLYKGLWSSHNDGNYFEAAYTCRRQFEQEQLLGSLYMFADNHDVTRIADRLNDRAYLYPLHILLFTLPGTPSVYYGSECGIQGIKKQGESDWNLRPQLTVETMLRSAREPDLCRAIAKLATIRKEHICLRRGGFSNLRVAPRQYAFRREDETESIVTCVNSAKENALITLTGVTNGLYDDVLNNERFQAVNGRLQLALPPCWGRILVHRRDI